jgi:hypothetical protein
VWRTLLALLEIAIFSALVLVTRCANYSDVFVGGQIYFVDADCYARMIRARTVMEHPGTIVRHHDFENFPAGTTPHTAAPLDYLIVVLAAALRPVTSQPLNLAGALISPLLALAGAWFLWWWSRNVPWPGRYAALLTYALSAILVHGTALGRPDQQGLLILLLFVALAAEWRLWEKPTCGWSMVSGISWGLALWVSLYEPLILLAAMILGGIIISRGQMFGRPRRIGWTILLGIVLLAALVERRWPEPPGVEPFFANWARTIGELQPLSLTNPIWLSWVGGSILFSPLLIAFALRQRIMSWFFLGLLILLFLLTSWEARWGYFFAIAFVLTIPAQFGVVRQKWMRAGLLVIALLPLLQFWDDRLWPNEETTVGRAIARREAVEWRAMASRLRGQAPGAILAPWWLGPAIAWWSGQPVVAGSSHESLPGIAESARFFLATSAQEARGILERRRVRWVLIGDEERVVANSAAILGRPVPAAALGSTLDRTPSQAPPFLALIGQNGACKCYQTRLSR